MTFEFYELIAGTFAMPELRHIEDMRIELPWSEADNKKSKQSAIEKKFDELVSQYPDIGLILVISPTLGRPPGAIMAAELSKATRSARELKWLHED